MQLTITKPNGEAVTLEGVEAQAITAMLEGFESTITEGDIRIILALAEAFKNRLTGGDPAGNSLLSLARCYADGKLDADAFENEIGEYKTQVEILEGIVTGAARRNPKLLKAALAKQEAA